MSATNWWKRLTALAELAGDGTQQEIAETLQVSPAAVSGWRHGGPPRPETVLAAARAYDADPLDLLRIAFIEDEQPVQRRKNARGTVRRPMA